MTSISLASIDLNLLVAFEAIFETGSVTAAAAQVHIGQPAMSAALGRLRSLFDDDLFIRIGRDMKPTAKALEIAPGITAALQQIRLTLQSSQQFDPAIAHQAFIIGCTDYASTVITPTLLQVCRQRAPGIDLRLISYEKSQISALLEQPTLAVILGSGFHDLPPHILQKPLMAERFVGICRRNHPAIRDGSLTLEQFVELPHALFTLRRDEVGVIDRALAKQTLRRRIVLTTPYWLTLPAIIANSDLVAAVPTRMAHQFTTQGFVDTFEIPLALDSWAISMVWSQLTDQAPNCIWLRQAIEEVCAGI
ncbi:MAG: LysR family transcriptional regulator [Synechococcales bacterium]|nr:LysR family transcriptional regulator [Synechococcales bacterium]